MRVYNGFDTWDAVRYAETALNHLFTARSLLKKAKGWSWADMFGGGLFITLAKRNRMKEAENELDQARIYINKMLAEIEDSSKFDYIRFNDSDALVFTDYLFDNVITDIIVQQKIDEILEEVDSTIYKVEAIKQKLYDM